MNHLTYLIGIAQRITGDECPWITERVHEHQYAPDIETVRLMYERDDAKWGPLVEHDVTLVLDGYMPEYFLHWHDWEEVYRSNHSIRYHAPNATFVSGEKTFSHISELIKKIHSGDLSYHLHKDSGWACPTEQTYFYNSPEWQRLAKAERFIGGYRCQRCGTQRSEIHVHHSAPIKTAYSPYFSDNFADWKLSLYCKNCHDWFHQNFTRQILANDFSIATPQEIREDRKLMRQLWTRYHAEGKCQFCSNHTGT